MTETNNFSKLVDHLLHKKVKTGDEKIQFKATLKAPRTIAKERERAE